MRLSVARNPVSVRFQLAVEANLVVEEAGPTADLDQGLEVGTRRRLEGEAVDIDHPALVAIDLAAVEAIDLVEVAGATDPVVVVVAIGPVVVAEAIDLVVAVVAIDPEVVAIAAEMDPLEQRYRKYSL